MFLPLSIWCEHARSAFFTLLIFSLTFPPPSLLFFPVHPTFHYPVISIDDIKLYFNVEAHPDYQNGRKSEEEILMEFIDHFDVSRGDHGIACFCFHVLYCYLPILCSGNVVGELM